MEFNSIGVLTVATNHYVNYWMKMAESLDNACLQEIGTQITLHVFTDQPKLLNNFKKSLKRVKVTTYEVPSFGWPEASLYRFRLIESIGEQLTDDFLVHLDADMIVKEWFPSYVPIDLTQGIGLVRHPGYFRPTRKQLVAFYFKNPSYIVRDLILRVRIGGLGSWETSRKSKAYVPRHARGIYVCGGTWMGYRDEFLKLVNEMSDLEISESALGKVPKWHDESYLNLWASKNEYSLLLPSFCFDSSYPQLHGLKELIQAVDKSDSK